MFEHEGGLTAAAGAVENIRAYSGQFIISLREHDLGDPDSLRAARHLLGGALQSHLGDRPLRTRQVLREIAARGYAG
jgi:hypothetical protein